MHLYLYDKSNDKRLQGEVFINKIFDEHIRRLHQGKKFFGKKMLFVEKLLLGNFFAFFVSYFSQKKFFGKMHFLAEKLFSLMKTSDIFVENLVNKKLLLAAFYHLTYQHDSKDFNICNYEPNLYLYMFFSFWLGKLPELLFLDPSFRKPA